MITPDSSEPSEDWQNMVLTKNKRDEFLIEIRKKKSDNLIKQKRIKLVDIQHFGIQEEKFHANTNKNNFGAPVEADLPLSEERKEQLEIVKNKFFESVQERRWQDLGLIIHFLKECIVAEKDRILPRAVIGLGIVPDLLNFLHEDFIEQSKVQNQAAWLLANLTAGTSEDVAFLVECNCIQIFSKTLKLKCDEVHENTMWALANIAGEEDFSYRDAVLAEGVLQDIVRNLCRPPKRALYTRTAVWLLSILVRGPDYPQFENVSNSLTILAQLIHKDDYMTLEYVLKSLQSLTESRDETTLNEISTYGFIPRIMKFVNNEDESISSKALHIVGNFALGSPEVTKQLVEHNIFHMLPNIIDSRNKSFRHEGCYILGNILTDKFKEHNMLIVHKIMPIIIQRLEDDVEGIRAEAANCISSFVFNCSLDEVQLLVSQGVIESLLPNLLKTSNSKLLTLTLKALFRILAHGEELVKTIGDNPYTSRIMQSNAGQLLEDLQKHQDPEIYNLVSGILDKFFNTDFV